MAVMVQIYCHRCHETKQESIGSGQPKPLICSSCRRAEAEEKKQQHFAKLDKLTIEERLRKIEDWIYDYKPRHVPPPTF